MSIGNFSFDETQIDIISGMIDWVRVIDKENKTIYANRKMQEDLGFDIIGQKCFRNINKKEACTDCIVKNTLLNGQISRKEIIINDKVYSATASPVKSKLGEIIGAVEVFRDITYEKELAQSLEIKNTKMSNDINFAKNMQIRMLPTPGIFNDLLINYLYKPSEMLSGDIFDVYKIDHEHTGIYICDVVGHGVTASLLTIFVRQSLRAISKNETNINKIIKELHKTFIALNLDSDKYFSVFFAIFNKKTKEFRYINAGHNSVPIFVRDGDIKMLEAKGYPICNIFDTVNYDANSISLKEKDKLVFYTDGIIETKNEEGQEFGMVRLLKIIKEETNILDVLRNDIEDFSNKQTDDYAVLVVDVI